MMHSHEGGLDTIVVLAYNKGSAYAMSYAI